VVVFFGSIPHSDLLKSVARRIVDRRVLHLIKMWLDCPVEETDDRGRKTRTTVSTYSCMLIGTVRKRQKLKLAKRR
jgi:hypothetical protein